MVTALRLAHGGWQFQNWHTVKQLLPLFNLPGWSVENQNFFNILTYDAFTLSCCLSLQNHTGLSTESYFFLQKSWKVIDKWPTKLALKLSFFLFFFFSLVLWKTSTWWILEGRQWFLSESSSWSFSFFLLPRGMLTKPL